MKSSLFSRQRLHTSYYYRRAQANRCLCPEPFAAGACPPFTMRALKINPGHAVTALALSPDGQKLGVVQSFHGFRLFDAVTGAELGHDAERATVFEPAPTNRHSLNAHRSAIRLAETTTGQQFMRFQTGWRRVGEFNRPPAAPVTSALSHVTALYQFGETRSPAVPRFWPKTPAGQFTMYECALTADHRFVVGRRDAESSCSVCDLATETVAAKLLLSGSVSNTDAVRVAFSADETRVVVVSPHYIAAFDLPPLELDTPPAKPPVVEPTFMVRVTQPQPEPGPPPFAVLPCGQKALLRSERSRVELRDLTTGEVLIVWKWGLPKVNALAVAGDGLTAVAGGAGGRVMMWDLG